MDKNLNLDQLNKIEQRYHTFLKQSVEGIWWFESDKPMPVTLPEKKQIEYFYQQYYLIEANEALAQMYGFTSADKMIGMKLEDIRIPPDYNNCHLLKDFIRSGYRLTNVESHIVDKSGKHKYYLSNLVGIIENGLLVGGWGIQMDFSRSKKTETELSNEQSLLQSLMDHIPDSIYFKDTNGRYIRINKPMAESMKLLNPQEAIGKTDFNFYPVDIAIQYQEQEQMIMATGQPIIDQVDFNPHSRRWCSITKSVCLDKQGNVAGIIGISRDITERKLAEEEIKTLAISDRLTHLLNYIEFYIQLSEEIERAKRYKRNFCLLMVDIDNFKQVNDTYGHQAGNVVICDVANLLRDYVRNVDYVARFGGDEFTILMPEIIKKDSLTIAERLCRLIHQHEVTLPSGDKIQVTVSIGIACYSEDGNTNDQLIHAADQALYHAKSAGKNQICPYVGSIEKLG